LWIVHHVVVDSGCEKCLKIATNQLPSCCSGKQGARVLIPSCNIRYEFYPFYHELNVPAPDEARPNPQGTVNSDTILHFYI